MIGNQLGVGPEVRVRYCRGRRAGEEGEGDAKCECGILGQIT